MKKKKIPLALQEGMIILKAGQGNGIACKDVWTPGLSRDRPLHGQQADIVSSYQFHSSSILYKLRSMAWPPNTGHFNPCQKKKTLIFFFFK